jgi:hypothetical protein
MSWSADQFRCAQQHWLHLVIYRLHDQQIFTFIVNCIIVSSEISTVHEREIKDEKSKFRDWVVGIQKLNNKLG